MSREGLLGQGTRFVIAGGTVSAVYLSTTTVLATVVGIPFEAALAIGFATALAVHFTLQRLFVWVHSEGFALAFRTQVVRYLLVALSQYAVTAATTSLLPSVLRVPTEVVYVGTVACATLINFLVFRRLVFHAGPSAADPP